MSVPPRGGVFAIRDRGIPRRVSAPTVGGPVWSLSSFWDLPYECMADFPTI
jgi:hypothetical protein